MNVSSTPEVVVLGGGPAGCVVARRLAQWGHAVRLIAPAPADAALVVSLPPSSRRVIDALGLADLVDACCITRARGNTVRWGNTPVRDEPFAPAELGWQVALTDLTRSLQAWAGHGGVAIDARRPTLADAAGPLGITVDATGRTGLVARSRGWRVHEPAQRTVALIGRWRVAGSPPDPTHTWIESYRDGWAWSVPGAGGLRHVAVMVDPRVSDLSRGATARAVYDAEVRKTTWLAALTPPEAFVDGPVGWDASMYHANTYADDHTILVGDAASFVDPLSSAGVKKALASAWLASVVIHTTLVNPAMAPAARELYTTRERENYAALRDMVASHMAVGGADAHPFWQRLMVTAGDDDPDAGASRAAFARLRAEPVLEVEAGAEWAEVAGAVVRDDQVRLEPHVRHADGRTRRFAHGVDLITVRALAPTHRDVAQLWAAYVAEVAPVALPDFLAAMATALAERILVWRGEKSREQAAVS